ncbi:hypothetical protein CC86DRAFT_458657 [Ophiobolus disseminans]|uniref:Apple domain-containing protein n=1 Tax=Ophiobolus disseminans TaxID=1469910 RepID=A0A6A6ZM11_9PLEO|nr:hypothetical protein CC86DRAFT_458657 [Ophiobolus disseminans]
MKSTLLAAVLLALVSLALAGPPQKAPTWREQLCRGKGWRSYPWCHDNGCKKGPYGYGECTPTPTPTSVSSSSAVASSTTISSSSSTQGPSSTTSSSPTPSPTGPTSCEDLQPTYTTPDQRVFNLQCGGYYRFNNEDLLGTVTRNTFRACVDYCDTFSNCFLVDYQVSNGLCYAASRGSPGLINSVEFQSATNGPPP